MDRTAIIQECTQLIARFADLVDAHDSEGVAALFTEDGIYARPTMPDKPMLSRAAILEGFRARPKNKMSRHVVTNTIVHVVSANEATATSYITLYTATLAEGATLPVPADAKQLLGAFRDTMVREGGEWKFKERRGSLALTIE